MGILDVITENPDAAIGGAATVLGWLGVARWRTKRTATAAEIDRWASSAAGAIELMVRHGVFTDNEAAVMAFLKRFTTLVTAAGVEIKPEHEARALLVAQEAITKAAQGALEMQAVRLGVVAEALITKLNAILPTKPKK